MSSAFFFLCFRAFKGPHPSETRANTGYFYFFIKKFFYFFFVECAELRMLPFVPVADKYCESNAIQTLFSAVVMAAESGVDYRCLGVFFSTRVEKAVENCSVVGMPLSQSLPSLYYGFLASYSLSC